MNKATAAKKKQTVGTCLECGVWVEYLPTHLKYAHGMTHEEYMTKHGTKRVTPKGKQK